MSSPILDPTYFADLSRKTLASRKAGEHLFLGYSSEHSQFIRVNAARVRQIGTIEDAEIHLTLVLEAPGGELRTGTASTTLTGLSYIDPVRLSGLLEGLRAEVPHLPVDPYAQLPQDHGSSEQSQEGALPSIEDATRAILEPLSGLDLAGIYAAGTVTRAMANSAGQLHWFSTRNFSLDYSLYTPAQRALKGTFAGTHWNADQYRAEIQSSRHKLALLEKPARKLERGAYRTYLEPAAYADLVQMLNWGGVSEAAIRQGDSPLRLVRNGTHHLSPLFTLSEDFTRGLVPRFNGEGELSPTKLALIDGGVLRNSLVSSRTAVEYKTASNGAEDHESMRAPSVAPGKMPAAEALKCLGTGLHLSNLHYLNWSDQPAGRITGMTRYACFWVENGEIVAPIENMRFDDSIFSLFGTQLEALSAEVAYLPDVHTYGERSLGGISCPGALIKNLLMTL